VWCQAGRHGAVEHSGECNRQHRKARQAAEGRYSLRHHHRSGQFGPSATAATHSAVQLSRHQQASAARRASSDDSREGCGTCSSHHKMHVIPACKSACGCVVVPAVTPAAAQPAGACANAVLACEACNHAQHNLCVLCEPQEPPWQQLDSLQAARCLLAVTRHNTAAEVQSRATAQQSWRGAQAL
jgi:hypothetical protein